MTNKRYGRVGDAPVIGAGTYANAHCAVSGTGWGEFYLRTVAAHDICARMQYLNESPEQAGEAVINRDIPALGGNGGAIVLGAGGRFGLPFNTEGMYRGWIGSDGVPHVAPYAEDGAVELHCGPVQLQLTKACTRCVITTIDHQRGERTGEEPLATLKTYRFDRELRGVIFGRNAYALAGAGNWLSRGAAASIIAA